MADCGASGSTIDRAVSSLARISTNGPNSAVVARATKAWGHFLGDALCNSNVAPGHEGGGMLLMPSAPPDQIHLEAFFPTASSPQQTAAMQNRQGTAPLAATVPYCSHGPPHLRHNLPPQIVQQQMQIVQQHQFQMHRMQQQQQMHMIQFQQQQQRHFRHLTLQSQSQNAVMKPVPQTLHNSDEPKTDMDLHKESDTTELHPSLSSHRPDFAENDDARSTYDERDEHYLDDLGHEGYVDGANIEQLAAAWAEAQRFDEDDLLGVEQGYYNTNEESDGLMVGDTPTERAYEFSAASKTFGGMLDSAASTVDQNRNVARQTKEAKGRETENDKPGDMMEQGMKRFQAGDISLAILSFESHLLNVDADSADAWLMLGKCHSEHDQDRKAIACFERAVERDPYSNEGLLGLGVCFVNEMEYGKALKCLRGWVAHHPTFCELEFLPSSSGVTEETGSIVDNNTGGNDEAALLELKALLHKALECDPNDRDAFADVLEALGVLCNVSREYDEAAQSFRRAIKLKEESALSSLGERQEYYHLWNKLGATLANSNQSEEALSAYYKALAMKPKYARAWLNMAISHSNLKNYEEAARCYLQTLSLNPDALHVWGYLRIALSSSERWEMLPLTATQNLEAFRSFFDFV